MKYCHNLKSNIKTLEKKHYFQWENIDHNYCININSTMKFSQNKKLIFCKTIIKSNLHKTNIIEQKYMIDFTETWKSYILGDRSIFDPNNTNVTPKWPTPEG